nr:MAG TPA: hypothetical protein [Caudoviricetes sp.]
MAYKRELIAETKNLFDSNNIDTQWLGIQYKSISNGKILLNGAKEAGANIFPVTRPNITLPAGSYTLSCRMLAGNIEGVEADYNKKIYFSINGSPYTYRCDGVGRVGDYTTKTFTLTEDTLLKTFDITAGYSQNFNINNVMIECQLEKGTAATDYVPYGYLTSYKKLLKVSDVCQLLDKSKYPATGTYDGVIYTNNGDGTITLNGTATAITNYNLQSAIQVIAGHKYLPFFCNTNIKGVYLLLYSDNDSAVFDNRFPGAGGSVVTCLKTYDALYYQIKVSTGISVSNLIIKPQLLDLTEMYGAGNEPATVAEFKAKFPNDLYDYSPRCWVTSYKTGLIAKTKNLFNINALTPYTPETLPTNTAGRYNGNIIARAVERLSISDGNTLLKELCPNMVAGERYILHFDTNGTSSQANTIYLNGSKTAWINGYTHVVTEAELNGTVFFYANYPKLTVATISNFQIEKGTTVTDYVPYGYL